MRAWLWATAVSVVVIAGGCGDSPSSSRHTPAAGPGRGGEPRPADPVDHLTLRQQVGQLLVFSFRGERAPGYVARILRAHTAAGAFLSAGNVVSPRQLRALTRSLQRAGGGSVLIATDQEGGPVRVIPFAGPGRGQAEQATPAQAGTAARAAARGLRALGVNVNLAPVADVAAAGPSAVRERAFPGGPDAVAARVAAAVRGARAGGVAPTVKHFPGFGAAEASTDDRPVTIARTAAGLRADDVRPFRAAIDAGAPLVMASHALYPKLDRERIASQSPSLLQGELRQKLGFRGVVITDSLEARAVIARNPVEEAAVRSVAAGADLLLMTGRGSYRRVFPRLLVEARRSQLFRRRVREAATRVLQLREWFKTGRL